MVMVGGTQEEGLLCCQLAKNSSHCSAHHVVLQLVGKSRAVAVKLAKAEKTGRDLQLLNMKKEDVATNQQHQQNYHKQMKVCMLCMLSKFR